jgi:MFS family permease
LIGSLLLTASAINYMDRQTLANVATRVTKEFALRERQYGSLETGFGFAFAGGSMFFGILADRMPVRWLYPIVLTCWSLVGFATGFVQSYEHLLGCRVLLGFFEAGHWPCGLKTTQLMMAPSDRAMGNSLLQSGTSIGAIITPPIMLWMISYGEGNWRLGFQVVGAIGLMWTVVWFRWVRPADLEHPQSTSDPTGRPVSWATWLGELHYGRLAVALIVVTLLNTTWQTLRAWLPKIMQQEHQFTEVFTSFFTSAWYAMTDVGCLSAGALAFALVRRRGWSVHGARAMTFGLCSLLCSGLILTPFLTSGAALLAVFLLSGAGALGMFPIYYSLTQDISPKHQGKVTGLTGVVAWTLSSPTQLWFGSLADQTKSFSTGIAIAGFLPLLAFLAILLLWPSGDRRSSAKLG